MRPAATGRRSSSDAATATTARRKTRSAIGPPLPPHGHGPGLLHGIISVCLKRDASDALLVVVTVGIASGVVMAGLRPSPSRRLYPPCLRNALSTSSDAFLLSKHMTYFIMAASQGSVILPSLANPNSSCDILRSSLKTVVPRYGNGTSNRLPSAVYTAQWPLSATGEVVQQVSSSLAVVVLTLCNLLAS
uniref:Uncharacterized protein n=1 Tax=Oryza punctata TaxID=4537 RepID=A0A0E0M429_ORYPU